LQPDHARDVAARDERFIERKVRVNNPPVALDAHVEHHVALDLILSITQVAQAQKVFALKLGHEAEAAEVDAQHRNVAVRSGFGKVQDRTVAAKRDDHVRAADLLLKRLNVEPVALRRLLIAKRQAHDIRAANLVEHALGLLRDAKLRVAVGIRA